MKDQIGLLAGKLWTAVGREPGIKMSQLCKTLGVDPTLAVLAAGWLLREEKLRLEAKGRDFVVSLTAGEQQAWQKVNPAPAKTP